MSRTDTEATTRPSVTTLTFVLTGLWLAFSPYVLGFAWETSAWWNALVIGIALVVLGLIRLASRQRFQGLRWTALILGAWMVASPFVSDYAEVTTAMWNAVLVGTLVVLISIFPTEERPKGRRGV